MSQDKPITVVSRREAWYSPVIRPTRAYQGGKRIPMKTKMRFPIPTHFQVIDRFLASVNTIDMPKRMTSAKVVVTNHTRYMLIRHQRNHFFLIDGRIQDIDGCLPGGFNCYIGILMELYAIMYQQRHFNTKAFRVWLEQAQAKEQRSENLENLKKSARELGYTIVKP